MLVRIANRKDPDQTTSSEAVYSDLPCLSWPFWQATSVRNFYNIYHNMIYLQMSHKQVT